MNKPIVGVGTMLRGDLIVVQILQAHVRAETPDGYLVNIPFDAVEAEVFN